MCNAMCLGCCYEVLFKIWWSIHAGLLQGQEVQVSSPHSSLSSESSVLCGSQRSMSALVCHATVCTVCPCVLKLHYEADVSTSLIWRDVADASGPWSSSKNTTTLRRLTQSFAWTLWLQRNILEKRSNSTAGILLAHSKEANLKFLMTFTQSEPTITFPLFRIF